MGIGNMMKNSKYNKYDKYNNKSAEQEIYINEYYAKIGNRFGWAKWVFVVALVLFVLAGLIFNSQEITFENINYLLRYINIQNSKTPAKSEFLIEFDEYSDICYYKNNIAVLKRNKIEIYDVDGRKSYNLRLIYSNPVIEASSRYILTYDLGSNKLDIFNAFSKVYEYKGDMPVYNAKLTDKGNVVYVTTEKGYKSAVKVMNSGFNEIYRCYFYKDFIVGADIDDNAKNLVTAGYSVENGDFVSTVTLYETNREEKKKEIFVYGELPYEVTFNSNSEGFSVLFENSVRFYDSEGTEISKYDFAYRQIQAILMTKNYSAVVLNEKTLGSDNRILVFDNSGNIIYDNVISAEIIDIKFSEDFNFLYFLTRTGLFKIDIEHKVFEFVTNQYDETTNRIIHANAKNIFLSGFVKVNIEDTESRDNVNNTENPENTKNTTDITDKTDITDIIDTTGMNNTGSINSVNIN